MYEEGLLTIAKNRATLGQCYAFQGDMERALGELEAACPILYELSKRNRQSSTTRRILQTTSLARQQQQTQQSSSSSSQHPHYAHHHHHHHHHHSGGSPSISSLHAISSMHSIEGFEASEGFIPCYAAMNVIFNEVQVS